MNSGEYEGKREENKRVGGVEEEDEESRVIERLEAEAQAGEE